MQSTQAALDQLRSRIERACAAAGRRADDVRLLGVSKAVGTDAIAAARAAGQTEFGENYVQEALPKMAALPGSGITWHFIGPIQSNKTAAIAGHFDWVHGVDREKIARRLSEQRPAGMPDLNICVQVNISGEDSKSGLAASDVAALCHVVSGLPRLRLRGLMAIPAPLAAGGDAREPYRRLRALYESLRAAGLQLDTLSTGMSDDFEAAIAEGSTLVRIGTALFGSRSP